MLKVDEKKFYFIKNLTNQPGVTNKDIAKVSGVGMSTVGFIKQVDNYQDWRIMRTQQARKVRESKKVKSRTAISEAKFDLIKELQKQDISIKATAELLNVSRTTVSIVRSHQTYQDFLDYQAKRAEKQRQKRLAESNVQATEAPEVLAVDTPTVSNQDELLVAVRNLTEVISSLDTFLRERTKLEEEGFVDRLFRKRI